MAPPLPQALVTNPLLVQWLDFGTPGVVRIRSGKVELGQGIGTALMQIAADALGVNLNRVRLRAGDTASTPDEGWTSASISIEQGGAAIGRACLEARRLFTIAAAGRLGAAADALTIEDGSFVDGATGAAIDYWTLASIVSLDRPVSEEASPPPPLPRRHVGTGIERHDLPAKLTGGGFIHDITIPDMLHGRVIRPGGFQAHLAKCEKSAIEKLPGVLAVVVDGDFIGLVADREEQAIRAADKAQSLCHWNGAGALPDAADGLSFLRTMPSTLRRVAISDDPPANASETHHASYSKPYIAHASIGLVCAIAQWDDNGLTVWTQSQGVFALRDNLARLFDMASDRVHIIHADGAGCYGHNGADDVAADAALLARAVQRPVRVVWTREQELVWAPFGSAMAVDVAATLHESGRIASWRQDIWSCSHLCRPGWGDGVNLLAGSLIAEAKAASPPADPEQTPWGGGGDRNAIPIYSVGACDVSYHMVTTPPLRTSALRSLGAFANVFAIESSMDELAMLAGRDPIEFRCDHLDHDPRGEAVIRAAAALAEWNVDAEGTGSWGRGVGFGRYKNKAAWCAVVVDVAIDETIRVSRVCSAVDAGLIVNPDGVRNQIEGGILQAISWTLKERVSWDDSGIVNRGWGDYPILRFDEVPDLHITLLDRSDQPSLGVGECVAGPIAAAIANAVAHALGVRVRDLPLTNDALIAAMTI